MLVLTRKQDQQLVIGSNITITILEARDGRVRLGIEAPRSTPIHRAEVAARIQAELYGLGSDAAEEAVPALSAACL